MRLTSDWVFGVSEPLADPVVALAVPDKPERNGRATSGNDVITGRAGDDVIDGLAGNDTIFGLGGNYTLLGGAGEANLHGGALHGGAGKVRTVRKPDLPDTRQGRQPPPNSLSHRGSN
jgi:hypothetical protein